MKFFVWWSTGQFEGEILSEFETEGEVLQLLNQNAKNTDFTFTVVEGREIEFKPVEVVQAYERKR